MGRDAQKIDETAADDRRIREMIAGTSVTEEDYRAKRLEMIQKGLSGDQAAIEFYNLTKTPWHSEYETAYPDAAPALAELKRRGYKLGVIANQPEGTEKRLRERGLLQYFDTVFSSAEYGAAKPDPSIFKAALARAGCPAENAVMIGDRLDNDVAPANRLGIHSVRILRGVGAYHMPQSADEVPENTVTELSELFDLL